MIRIRHAHEDWVGDSFYRPQDADRLATGHLPTAGQPRGYLLRSREVFQHRQIHLVEKTMDEILEELPELTDDDPVDADLLARMRPVALLEIRVHDQLPEDVHHER